ncbi:MAG TPA: UvrD-helicase domain-containing protein [Gemmatimonadaceae bacterium]|nr:UvrD-helicase domain-containing protein [Gemmatimonadaceae bacterium]
MIITPPGEKSPPALNAAQREAVEHGDGPLLVLAGAGSGKTRVLTTRIARLIQEGGARANQILAVTFTNKAAGEMKARVARLLGEEPAGMWIGTFHAIGARMLRANAALAGLTPAFTIYDEDDTLAVVKRLMDRHNVSTKIWAPRVIASAISDARNALVPGAEYTTLAQTPLARAVAPVYADLGPTLRAANAVSFDDLLRLPVELLSVHADVRERYERRFQHVLVDEYQDTNRAQYEFVRLLASRNGNVVVVGDDDQAIYGWRGADVRNILDFERDYPSAHVVRLEDNYRSAPPILAFANVIIADNDGRRGKTLRATRDGGEPVSLLAALDDRDEADFIAEEIENRRTRVGDSLGDVAVLYRTNAQSRLLEESLRRRALPYRLVGAVRFYDRREIRDLLAWLRLIANPADDEAFRRAVSAPRRGIGDTTIEMLALAARDAGVPLLEAARRVDTGGAGRAGTRQSLREFAALVDRFRDLAVDAGVDRVITELVGAIGYAEYLKAEGPEGQERLENVAELVRGAAELVIDEGGEVGLRPLDHFLQRATLVAGIDLLGPDADAVTMMTLHTAKGLEFPVVFISGLEDGLFPLSRSLEERALLEEERRLFYVGITRAERKLYLTWARSRRRNGELLPSAASSFLTPAAEALLDKQASIRLRASGRSALHTSPRATRVDWAGDTSATWRRNAAREHPVELDELSQDLPAFVEGERVRHRIFGSGRIAEMGGSGRDVKVTVDFDDEAVGRKRLVVAFAGLERAFD